MMSFNPANPLYSCTRPVRKPEVNTFCLPGPTTMLLGATKVAKGLYRDFYLLLTRIDCSGSLDSQTLAALAAQLPVEWVHDL